MTAAECLEAMHDDVARFDAMLANPAMFEANSPDMDAEDYIALHELFYLLEPMEERWGKWVSWKCMCESFFSNGICGHSTLMALLYDSSLEFPGEVNGLRSSFRVIVSRSFRVMVSRRRGQNSPPNAWAEFH